MSIPIDSVYFFMWAGWRNSARSNRWHYGLRWGRYVPVVFLQPELPEGAPWCCEPEPRIQNVEILSIRASNGIGRPSFDDGLVQARQIVSYMRRRGHSRPLLWMYNPYLTFAYALVPASLRVYHATENYFDFDMPNFDLADLKRSAIEISEKVICCSTGVFAGCRAATSRADLEMIPNGCDYRFYAQPRPPKGNWIAQLDRVLSEGKPIAVYAGNINLRMDFPLMHRLAEQLREVQFVYAGPVDHGYLAADDRTSWSALLRRPNVVYLGFLDPDDLPKLYSLADRGFIPYRPLPLLVKNGFPLKALEMAAAGLPVVSSLMEPLHDVREAVDLVADGASFVERLREASRRTRPAEASDRADTLCRAYDYDRRFEQMLSVVIPAVDPGPPQPASLRAIYDRLGLDRTLWDLEPSAPRSTAVPATPEIVGIDCAAPDTPTNPNSGAIAPLAAYWQWSAQRLLHPLSQGVSLSRQMLWRISTLAVGTIPQPVKSGIKRLLIPPPRQLSWGRRLLWRIPPIAATAVPTPVKSAVKRLLRV